MTRPTSDVERQIEAAFDYRGHVTITLAGGETLIGYLFNRSFQERGGQEPFIEVIPKDSEERRRFAIREVRSVELTGKDCAAGNSFEDYLQKKNAAGK